MDPKRSAAQQVGYDVFGTAAVQSADRLNEGVPGPEPT